MKTVFQSKFPKGYLDLYEAEERLFVSSAFRREAQGVCLEVPAEEAADLAEALLRHLDERSRESL